MDHLLSIYKIAIDRERWGVPIGSLAIFSQFVPVTIRLLRAQVSQRDLCEASPSFRGIFDGLYALAQYPFVIFGLKYIDILM